MKIIENENARRLIDLIVPENILKLKPVIAGGFVTSLYYLAIRYSSQQYDIDLQINIERATNRKIWKSAYDRIVPALTELNTKFGDIDLWFLKDNPIWSPDHVGNFLLKDFIPDQDSYTSQTNYVMVSGVSGGGGAGINTGTNIANQIQVWSPNQGGGVANPSNQLTLGFPTGIFPSPKMKQLDIPSSFKNEVKNYPNCFAAFGLQDSITSSSYWANSFTTNLAGESWTKSKDILMDNIKLQMVKKQYKDIEELFSKFDLINCCAAYYDGKFYFHDDFENAVKEHRLEMGASFHKPTTLGKIWSATRAFKYAKRFDLEFSKEICDSAVDTFIEAEILEEKTKNLNSDDIIDLGQFDEIDNPYGRNGKVSVHKLQCMIMGLFNSGVALFTMKEFDKERILMFVNVNHHAMKDYILKYLEAESEKYQKEQNIFSDQIVQPESNAVEQSKSLVDDFDDFLFTFDS